MAAENVAGDIRSGSKVRGTGFEGWSVQEVADAIVAAGLDEDIVDAVEAARVAVGEVDVHFPPGTSEEVVRQHLFDAHADRAPWGGAFIDERPDERPSRVFGVHAWCHQMDGTTGHDD